MNDFFSGRWHTWKSRCVTRKIRYYSKKLKNPNEAPLDDRSSLSNGIARWKMAQSGPHNAIIRQPFVQRMRVFQFATHRNGLNKKWLQRKLIGFKIPTPFRSPTVLVWFQNNCWMRTRLRTPPNPRRQKIHLHAWIFAKISLKPSIWKRVDTQISGIEGPDKIYNIHIKKICDLPAVHESV